MRSWLVVMLAVLVSMPAVAQQKMPSGFYYPTNKIFTNDGNWLATPPQYEAGHYHLGEDIAGAGDVYALGPGRVVCDFTAISDVQQKFMWVEFDLKGGGHFYAVYGHVNSKRKSGEVLAGEVIATVASWPGNTHCHLGIRPGGITTHGWGKWPLPRNWNGDPGTLDKRGFTAPFSYLSSHNPPSSNLPPNTPTQLAPSDGMNFNTRFVELSCHDNGDQDNSPGPHAYREFAFEVFDSVTQRIVAESGWKRDTDGICKWTCEVPYGGQFEWDVRAGDGELDSPRTGRRKFYVHASLPVWITINRQTSHPWGITDLGGTWFAVHKGWTTQNMYWDERAWWSDWLRGWPELPGRTDDAVDVTSWRGGLVYIHKGLDAMKFYIGFGHIDGSFSGWYETGRSSTTTPSMTVWNDRLWVIHKGSGNRDIYYSAYDGSNWSTWWLIDGQTDNRPVITTFAGQLWLGHIGLEGNIYIRRITGGDTGWIYTGRGSRSPQALVEFEGKLVILHRGLQNTRLYLGYTRDGTHFSEWRELPGGDLTNMQPGLFRDAFGRVYATRTGLDGTMYYMDITDFVREF